MANIQSGSIDLWWYTTAVRWGLKLVQVVCMTKVVKVCRVGRERRWLAVPRIRPCSKAANAEPRNAAAYGTEIDMCRLYEVNYFGGDATTHCEGQRHCGGTDEKRDTDR